jgi:UDP-glucose 4-epimerase
VGRRGGVWFLSRRIAVTGGCGFIGSHLVDRLLAQGDRVVIVDNLSTGQMRFAAEALADERVTLVQADVKILAPLVEAFRGCDEVYHLAANADVRFGPDHPRRDLDENTIGTFNVLEAMRLAGVSTVAFSSTGSVYGESQVIPTPEDAPFPIQTSLYGASKLAGEGLMAAYAEAFGFRARIFRFVSILGERYSHGHVFDFYRRLLENPHELHVLGNGKQRKSYLYVQDCIDAILTATRHDGPKVAVYNLGQDEYCQVNDSIAWITSHLGLSPTLVYSGGDRGWIGDNPFIFLDCSRMRSLGWRPQLSIRDSVIRTVEYLRANHWLFESRA